MKSIMQNRWLTHKNHRLSRLVVWLLLISAVLTLLYTQHRIEPPLPVDNRLLKISADAKPLHNWDGSWACVYDRTTQLLWEVKTDSENIHDGYWSYSWFDGEHGQANLGDCYFEANRCDSQDLINRTNYHLPLSAATTANHSDINTKPLKKNGTLCGQSDWRLPSADELASLVDTTVPTGAATINRYYFPHSKRGDYWTANKQQPLIGVFSHQGMGATAINFASGERVNLPYRNAAFVRLVSDSFALPNHE